MDVSTRTALPTPATAHPRGQADARATPRPSVRDQWSRSVHLRVAVAALLLGAAAAVAVLEDRASDDVDELRSPSVNIVPLAP